MISERVFGALLILVATPILASEKARTIRLRVGGESVRIVVPKTFEPLLPGSVYPNRRKPADARRLPVAILAPETAPALEFLLERQFLVAVRHSASVEDLLAALATRPEADPGRAAILVFRETPILPAAILAIAIFDPDLPARPAATQSSVALFLRTPRLVPSAELSRALNGRFGPGVVEKWYRSEKGFPEQAYRDAAEWTAAMLSR